MTERFNAGRIGIPADVGAALHGLTVLVEDLQHLRGSVDLALRYDGIVRNRAEILEMNEPFRPRIEAADRTFSYMSSCYDGIGRVQIEVLAGAATVFRDVLDKLIRDEPVELDAVTESYESGRTIHGVLSVVRPPIPDLTPAWRDPRSEILDASYTTCRPALEKLLRVHEEFAGNFHLSTIGDLFDVDYCEASDAVEATIQPLANHVDWLSFTVKTRNSPVGL